MINPLRIINDYKNKNLPLDMVAKNNNVSLHFVLKVVHYHDIKRREDISNCKKIIKELEDEGI